MRSSHVYRFGALFILCTMWAAVAGIEQTQIPWAEPVTFNRTFGESGSDEAASVRQTSDGGYILAGSKTNTETGFTKLWLIKTTSLGAQQWSALFGEDFGFTRAAEVRQTTDGGYVAIGSYQIAKLETYLLKTDSSGNEEWSYRWDCYPPIGCIGTCVEQTTDGGYITSGTTFGTPGVGWLSKRNAQGNEQWFRYFSDIDFFSEANSVRQTADGGYIVCGAGYPGLDQFLDLWLIKTDAAGTIQWQRHYGGLQSEIGYCVQQTLEGGYIAAGITYSYGAGGVDGWLLKTDAAGTLEWEKTFGGAQNEELLSVQQTPDGGYILAGTTASYGAGNNDAWLIKTDPYGNTVWEKTYGASGSDRFRCARKAADGGYIVAGSTNSFGGGDNIDAWLVKTDEEGNAPATPSGR